MNVFSDALSDCNLHDLGFTGPIFTWSNNRTDPYTVRCRLDRACGNNEWMSFAPTTAVENLHFPGSDHVPLLLSVRRLLGGSKWTVAASMAV